MFSYHVTFLKCDLNNFFQSPIESADIAFFFDTVTELTSDCTLIINQNAPIHASNCVRVVKGRIYLIGQGIYQTYQILRGT